MPTFGATIREDHEDDTILTLLNLTQWKADVQMDLSLKELSLMMSRIEDVSHILVWGIWNADVGNFDVVSVEPPRLRARFQPTLLELMVSSVYIFWITRVGLYVVTPR